MRGRAPDEIAPPRGAEGPGPHETARAQRVVSQRARAILILFGLCFALLIYRVVTLMVLPDPQLDRSIARQYEGTVTLHPVRGPILDRNGRELAVSMTLDSIFADPALVEDPAGAAAVLAPVLDLSEQELLQKLRLERRFVWLQRQVDPATSEAVQDLGLRGVRATPEAQRHYPNGELAGQLIGFVGVDGNGLEGLEARYDEILMGEKETYAVLRDGRRRNITPDGVLVKRSTEGHSIQLTIDRQIQFIAERALDRAVEEYTPHSALAIVMDPRNGDVLAMANVPEFDLNHFGDYERATYRNHAISDTFEPGSIMKPFLFAAALDAGMVTPGELFDCENGNYRIGRNTIHDTHDYEQLSLEEVLQVSSNIGSAKIADRLGAEALHGYYTSAGFGRSTGIDLTAESGGILRDWRSWRRIGLATHAFGQGVSVTGVQLAAALSALANGGTLYRPRIIDEVRDRDGNLVDAPEPVVVDHVFTADAAALVRGMMGLVVEEGGTGTRARLDHYTCGGKTGTAQKVNSETGRYDRSMWVSSFTGFAPLEHPRVVVVVVVDEPHGAHYGGTVAGPVFKEIATRSLQTLGVPPMETSYAELPLEPVPEPALEPVEGGALVMLVEDLTDGVTDAQLMPDLQGMTVRSALRALGDRAVELRVEGSGLLAEQTPPAGAPLRDGDVVVLAFAGGERGTR